jgi:membrane protein implicated in regulation of membrane protease activity
MKKAHAMIVLVGLAGMVALGGALMMDRKKGSKRWRRRVH